MQAVAGSHPLMGWMSQQLYLIGSNDSVDTKTNPLYVLSLCFKTYGAGNT
jgi:hypothetical protein